MPVRSKSIWVWLTTLTALYAVPSDCAELKPVSFPPPGTVTVSISELQALRLENADLKYTLSIQQSQAMAQIRAAVMAAVCSELKLTDCSTFDPQARTATGLKLATPKKQSDVRSP
jgi:hypothetical protein